MDVDNAMVVEYKYKYCHCPRNTLRPISRLKVSPEWAKYVEAAQEEEEGHDGEAETDSDPKTDFVRTKRSARLS